MIKKLLLVYFSFATIFLFTAVKAFADNPVVGSVNITSTVPDTTVTFSGFASASATVSIKDGGTNVSSVSADSSGNFAQTISTNPGTHTFALYQTDTSGRVSPETTFSGVSVPVHIDTPISNIHLAPTISLTKTTINTGESVGVLGRGAAGSTIHVFLNGVETFTGLVGAGTDWEFDFSSGYVDGANTLYAYLTRTGLANSVNSTTVALQVGNCRRSDLNCDGFVNLTDFSILLYHWNTNHAIADTNHDGTVGIIDFSIMLFDWTG